MTIVNTSTRRPPAPPPNEAVPYAVIVQPPTGYTETYEAGHGFAWDGKGWIHWGDWADDVEGTPLEPDEGTVIAWVDTAAHQAPAPIAPPDQTPVESEAYSVHLTGFNPTTKIHLIKLVREMTGLSLGEAKAAAEASGTKPVTLRETSPVADAKALLVRIHEAGGQGKLEAV